MEGAVSCVRCDGKGFWLRGGRNIIPEYQGTRVACFVCDGTGRLAKKTVLEGVLDERQCSYGCEDIYDLQGHSLKTALAAGAGRRVRITVEVLGTEILGETLVAYEVEQGIRLPEPLEERG